MKINTYVVGMVQTNCYVVINEETKQCFLVDPGASSKKLEEKLREEGLTLTGILLTHGHFDHVGGAEKLAKEFGVSRYALEEEKQTLEDPQKNVSWLVGLKEAFAADVFLRDDEELKLAGITIRVIHTPGHTEGGCCYFLPEEGALFSGDTLFAGSVGRTDFPGGSMSQIVRSVRERLFTLTFCDDKTKEPLDIQVFPGHGEPTTIETERINNPYL